MVGVQPPNKASSVSSTNITCSCLHPFYATINKITVRIKAKFHAFSLTICFSGNGHNVLDYVRNLTVKKFLPFCEICSWIPMFLPRVIFYSIYTSNYHLRPQGPNILTSVTRLQIKSSVSDSKTRRN